MNIVGVAVAIYTMKRVASSSRRCAVLAAIVEVMRRHTLHEKRRQSDERS